MIRGMAVALRPPYSTGQPTAAQPPPLRSRCHAARRCCDFSPESEESSASSSLARKGGRYSSSHARSSSRNASSSGARAKSTAQEASRGHVYTADAGVRHLHWRQRSTMPLRGWTVDFTFDAEQLALQDVARRAMGEVGGDSLRPLADDPSGVTPELWDRLVSMGWTGMLVPGEGAGLLEMGIILEQMGRVPLPGPFFSSAVMATLAARALGADSLLPGLASGASRG